MVFQVLINFNDKKNKPLCVADSEKEFNNTTVRELKEKFKSKFPGAPDPDDVRVFFGKDPLEDDRTLAYYRIKHLSVLLFVMKMPGGGASRMVFQVLINFNEKKNKPLHVADSEKEFNNTTVRELKEKFRSKFPEAPDPDDVRVFFGKDSLEDDHTLAYYKIKHLSVLLFVMKMPGGGAPPKSRGIESFGKAEAVGLLGRFWLGTSFSQSGAQKEIQERNSASQYKGATKPHSVYDFSEQWRDLSDASVRFRREEKKETEKYDHHPPAEASSIQPDADLQFLQSLLPALKRMDLRRREFTKTAIQQLVYETEFNPRFAPQEGMRRTDSKEYLPPNM